MNSINNNRLKRVFVTISSVAFIQLLVFLVFCALIDDQWHSCGKRYYFIWPSILAAQLGYSHTWLISALVLPAYFVSLLFLFYTKRLNLKIWNRILVIFFATVFFFASGWVALDFYPNPLPDKTPYDNNPQKREIYLKYWNRGFRIGKMGWWRSFGLGGGYPHEMKGFFDGQDVGNKNIYRTFGNESGPDTIPVFWFSFWTDYGIL